jgi:hypothetical protein
MKFPAFYGNRRYITMVTGAHNWTYEPDGSLIGKRAELKSFSAFVWVSSLENKFFAMELSVCAFIVCWVFFCLEKENYVNLILPISRELTCSERCR